MSGGTMTGARMTGATESPTVVIYGRDGCHLCADALSVIERARARVPFELVQIDIESDDELLKRYLERIPVVTVDGVETFEFFVEEQTLLDRVKAR